MMRQFLIIDADDTLWENNIYFERAFEDFVAFLDHSSLSAPQIRDVLDEIEAANARIHGYGSLNFGRNLRQTYENLAERAVQEEDLKTVLGFAERILECPMQVIDGVAETLEYLAGRHDLTLFTKGHPEEQKLKIDRSGLGVYFGHTAIVKEKDAAGLPPAGGATRHDAGQHVDDREQSEVRHQSGHGGGAERRVHAPCPYLGAGEAGNPSRDGAAPAVGPLRRPARLLLAGGSF